MVRIEDKTLEELLEVARELLQDSTVTKIHKLTYQAAVTNYTLPGYTTDDERVLSIEAIEGISLAGDWVTEEDGLVEDTDYSLYDNYGTVDSGYGAASGELIYHGITITTLTFKDNSTVYIRFKYQNPDFVPVLTNFAGTSQIILFLSSVFSNLQQDLTTLRGAIDSFGLGATGDPLDRMVTIAGLTRTAAVAATGKVEVTNTSSTETFSITSSTRFVARRGASFIEFKSVTGSGSVAPNSTATIDVEAVVAGKQGNVGPYSIVAVFTDSGLTSLAPSYITVTNPPTISGSDNIFDNGSDEESDTDLQRRFETAMKSTTTSSHASLEKAAEDTNLIHDARSFDISTHKGISLHSVKIIIQTPDSNLLSLTSLTVIQQAVEAVQPSGQTLSLQQTMHVYLTIKADIFVSAATLSDTSDLETDIENTLVAHVNSKIIGEDLLPSTLLALIISTNLVRDASITETTVTEFVVETPATDTEIELSNSSGTEQNRFALQIHFNSVTAKETAQYDGISAFLDVANTPIDERTNPRVNKAVLDYNNDNRPSPLNITDFFSSVSGAGTRINFDPNADTSDPIVSGEDVIYDYDYYDNVTIDGIRILLNGVDGEQVDIELRSGATPDVATLVHADTQQTITLDGGGVAKLYTVEFTTSQTLDPANNLYWIFVTRNSGNSDVTKIVLDSTNYPVPFNPELHIDGQGESTPGAPDGSYERLYNRATYHTYRKYTGGDVYTKVPLPSKSFYAESSRILETTLTFLEFIEV